MSGKKALYNNLGESVKLKWLYYMLVLTVHYEKLETSKYRNFLYKLKEIF